MTPPARLTHPAPGIATPAQRLLNTPQQIHHWRAVSYLLAIYLVIALLAGCKPLVQSEQHKVNAYLPLREGKTVGQTFSARYDGLQRIAIYIRPLNAGQGTIRLTLTGAPQEDEIIRQVSQPAENITKKGYVRFGFEPLSDSARQDYYLRLELEGEGSYQVAIAPGDTYTSGSAYKNDRPVDDAQLAFRLIYDQRQAALGLLGEIGFWLGLLVAGFALYILPGWALLSLFYTRWGERRWAEKLALSGGMSLALYPLLYLYTSLLGARLGMLYAWLPPTLAALYLLVKAVRGYRNRPANSPGWQSALRLPAACDMAFLAVTLLIFASRFWPLRTLAIPMWGDSYHHSMIAQLLVDHGGLFNSWAPYAEMQTFTYHFGFHTLVAGLHYLTGLDLPAATLWAGQLVNGLAVISLYPLALRLGRNPWGGVIAVLLAGLLSPMPMYYVNWGRYTQLAGQVILVVGVYLTWEYLAREGMEAKRERWRIPLLIGIALAGLALTHLRVVIMAALFIAAFCLVFLRRGTGVAILRRVLVMTAIAGLLFLPWLVHTFSGRTLDIFAGTLEIPAEQVVESASEATAGTSIVTTSVGNLFDYLPALVWLSLPVLIGWGLWRRDRGILLVSLWWWLIWIAGEPGWYGLPGSGAISAFAVLIAAYIPAGLYYSAATGWLAERLRGTPSVPEPATPEAKDEIDERPAEIFAGWRRLVNPLLALAVIAAACWGAWQRLGDVDIPDHALVLPPDLRAFEWVEANLPPESRFLLNGHLAFYDTTAVGTDGGWWLPLLAGRQTTIPPMNYAFEEEPWTGYQDWINSLYEEIQAKGIDHPDVLDELSERRISHVYIGQQQGSVSQFGQFNFDLQALQASPRYRLVYRQDRVWIFQVLPE
jgi:hypothetical protein